MKTRIALAALALAAALSPTPAMAGDDEPVWKTRIVADKPGPLTLDPAKAYVLVDTTGLVMPVFLQRPSPEEAARWADKRKAELAKEHAKWEKKVAAWDKAAGTQTGPRPVEPTEDNFSFPTYEQAHQFMAGPENRFNKQEGSRYLQEVPPGTYVFYGVTGTCACLGTAAFEAPAGKIVTVGLTFPFFAAWRDAPKDTRPKTTLDLPEGTTTMLLGTSNFTDPRFPEGSVIRPKFMPAGQLPNWGGTEVDRIMAMPGVFRYERDKQVAETPAP